jgi:hypothetical protein
MGGTDDHENLIELTPEDHAEAHRLLYEQHGYWQDYVAWQGLAKLASKAEHTKMLLSLAGKKGNQLRQLKGGNSGMKYNTSRIKESEIRKGAKNPNAKEYIVVLPDGTCETVKSLKTWCESKGLNYNSFYNQCVGRKKQHNGYSVL